MRAVERFAAVAVLGILGACSAENATPDPVPTPEAVAPAAPTPAAPSPTAEALTFRAAAALETVRDLAGGIGPREATTARYRRAAELVGERLRELGYDVEEQTFRVPAGTSWGVAVPAGSTVNVIAAPPGWTPDVQHLVVGAHLDTVPQAPGAEDNASGVAVLLELARMAAAAPAAVRMPVVFVAFGAEEPRGPGDENHHYGSRFFVDELSGTQRAALAGMVSLDRVGVGAQVPICNGGRGNQRVVQELRATARRTGIATRDCTANRSSDHWSFEKAGFDAARLGSTPYAEYHSAADRPDVVARTQLDRVGRLMWAWLTGTE